MSAPVGGGGARYGRLCLRLAHWGCANRPFYHIVVAKRSFPNRRYIDPIEQVAL
jgi:ribosomal protein S16